ncbi:MAG: PAS domain S-box protein [Sphingobacteriales bacterium]|nr:PAS domain S-box protein [Sphingobacteriales bacterium]
MTDLCSCIKEGLVVVEKATGKVVFCNETWLRMFDLSGAAEMGMPLLMAFRKVKLSEAEIAIRQRMLDERGLFNEHIEYISSNGRSFWGEVTFRQLQKAESVYWLAVITKIDNVRKSEQQAAQYKQRFGVLVDHASMGIIETDCQAYIININRFALNLFGYSKREIINKKIELLIPERFHSHHVHHRGDYISQPKNRPMGVGMDLFAIKKDGTEFPVEVSLSNYTRNGNQYVIAFVSDISVRKNSEMEVKKLNDVLEETVEQRTKELRVAVSQLERSKENLANLLRKEKDLSELKSRFVSMASHEFRTPLSTILSSAYLLEQYNTGDEKPKREKHLKRIVSSVNMLTDILNDFLSVGKIEEGKIHVRYSEFDMQELVIAVIEEIKNNLRKGQVIRYEHEGKSTVFLDASLLKHIVMNLVSNAGKFSPEDSDISIRTVVAEGYCSFSIKDRGMGISKDDQQHLMERFFRGANASNVQGTGLGLHIVSKYLELMDGTISCTSEVEKGTEFLIVFNIKASHHEKDTDH